jgi:Insertion element 4 transposase N-terminal/Transposase DDE domain
MLMPISSQNPKLSAFQDLLPLDLLDLLSSPSVQTPASKSCFRSAVGPFSPREIGLGVISYYCNPEVVDRIVTECGSAEQRCRQLPARLVVYANLFMCLRPDLSYQKLMCHVADAAPAHGLWIPPNPASFSRARMRLGSKVMERLYRTQARPLAQPDAQGCFWRGRRLMIIDGTTTELQNIPELAEAFGGQPGEAGQLIGSPMLRTVSLTEAGTRAMVDVEIGAYAMSEHELAACLARSVGPGDLILADRNFPSLELWKRFTSAGADLLWRAKSIIATRVISHLHDATYLARFGHNQTVVRVIEYLVEGSEEIYRLITNMLDPRLAPAEQLARLYHERWEVETSYRELKSEQAMGMPLRSRTPQGVLQEIFSHCLLYNIIRQLMYEAAMDIEDRDPDRISFTLAKDAIGRSICKRTGLKMVRLKAATRQVLVELSRPRELVVRTNRTCPRILRHRYPKYPNRTHHPGPLSTNFSRPSSIFTVSLESP